MTVQALYDRYRILPTLQLHQLRVAGVARLICENSLREIDAQAVILAGLFHDMGNLIKSDLTLFPEFLEPLGQAHWEIVKQEFIEKYGLDSHKANVAIAKEIGLPELSVRLIDTISFSHLPEIRDGHTQEIKVIEYADLRVGPHGVIPLRARVEEGKIRYTRNHPDRERDLAEWQQLFDAGIEIEKQLFAGTTITAEDITEQAVEPYFDEFRAMTVAC